MGKCLGGAVDLIIELARQEGEAFRSVMLCPMDDGGVEISTQDMGPTVESVWGDSDYEFGVKVGADALPQLVLALLKERYGGNFRATDDFEAFCKAYRVPCERWLWA